MSGSVFETVEKAAYSLDLDLTAQEFAIFAEKNGLSENALNAIESIFMYLEGKQKETTVQTLLRMSRLPVKVPKTFENFDFNLLKGKDVESLKALPTLSAIYAHSNLAFIGPPGTGKTHLAQAFGYACCSYGLKTYFIKASELKDRLTKAIQSGKSGSVVLGLVRPSCLIIDEIGHCSFGKEETRLFFDVIDRRYHKEGNYNTVFTSNKMPSEWGDDFDGDDTLLCALDRVFDDATVFKIRGKSYRGKRLKTVTLEAIDGTETRKETYPKI